MAVSEDEKKYGYEEEKDEKFLADLQEIMQNQKDKSRNKTKQVL